MSYVSGSLPSSRGEPMGHHESVLPPAIFLMGPTAAGKTDLAVALAERLPVDIISVDSAMVYRDMDIGTAKPEPEVLARAPHALIDLIDPAEAYSAARFRDDALAEMARITAAGRIPLLVGGTMLYYRALQQGLSPLPQADPAIRARLELEAQRDGWEQLHQRLAEVDPEAADRIHRNDPQRLQRALEVYELTGRPMSELWRQKGEAFPYRVAKLVVAPADRELLRERISLRFQQMLEQGFVDEVERLWQRGDLRADMPSIRCVGYRQVWGYLADEYDYETMTERAITATRQFAKRQFTWLRSENETQFVESTRKSLLNEALAILSERAII